MLKLPQIGVYYLNEKKGRKNPDVYLSLFQILFFALWDARCKSYSTKRNDDSRNSSLRKWKFTINSLKLKRNIYRWDELCKPTTISASEKIFAPSTNGVGYPQSREITDGTGSIFVSTSEYARFANVKLPSGTGDVIYQL